MSPRARTLIEPERPTRPRSRSSSGVTSVPASKRSAIASRLTTSYSTRNGLWKARFGTRRCSGIGPPSKPRLNLKPDRDFAPLWPRPAVLPLPEPCPRPIRFFACLAPAGGFGLPRSIGPLYFCPLNLVIWLSSHLVNQSAICSANHPINHQMTRRLDDQIHHLYSTATRCRTL